MTAILMTEVGDVYLDEYNNTVKVSNKVAFEQILDGLIHCDLGSEIMNQMYGFDLKTAIRESYTENAEMFIESLIAQAINPETERLIASLNYVKATRSGREMNVMIQVTSIFNETATITGDISGI